MNALKIPTTRSLAVAKTGENIMDISIKCAHEGVTTGEWSDTMRDVFGEYRAPTGIVSSSIKKRKTKYKYCKI